MTDEPAGTFRDSPRDNSATGTPSVLDAIPRTAVDATISFSVTMFGPCSAAGSGEEK
jgi:hypothetical protein